jgi:hypothetical protein
MLLVNRSLVPELTQDVHSHFLCQRPNTSLETRKNNFSGLSSFNTICLGDFASLLPDKYISFVNVFA